MQMMAISKRMLLGPQTKKAKLSWYDDEKAAPVKLIDEKCDKDKGCYVEPAHLGDYNHSRHFTLFEKILSENFLTMFISIISHWINWRIGILTLWARSCLRKYLPKTFYSSVHLDIHLPGNRDGDDSNGSNVEYADDDNINDDDNDDDEDDYLKTSMKRSIL